MNIYQKAIKVRKVCETQSKCDNCKYYEYCKKNFQFHLRFTPLDVTIEDLANVIKNQKWIVK